MPDVRKHPTQEQLASYSLGKLPPAELAAVHTHLADCSECRRKVENQPTASFIGQLPAGGPSGSSMLPTLSPSPSNTSLPVGRSAEAGADDVPAELARSPKFEILGKLGQGAMGVVFKARHTFLNELVAIKVMNAAVVENADARKRFLREMQATGKLKHPNIVRALDAEQIGDLLILVMEYVAGITLDRLVKQRGPLPVDFACQCIVQAAMGLQHAHEKGMVHRDIKPANLMVAPKEKEVKLLDFGLVRGSSVQTGTRQTKLQSFMGTPAYVAPEQAGDARNADVRADVYSLGCTLYFVLAGRPPFQKDTFFNTILAQVQDAAQPLTELRKDVPAELWLVVAKMMAKKPEARYQTAMEAAKALSPFLVDGKAQRADARPLQASATSELARARAPQAEIPPVPAPPRAKESPFAVTPATGPPRPRRAKANPKRLAWMVGAVVTAGFVLIALVSVLVLTLRTGKGKAVVQARPDAANQVAAEKGEKKKPEVKTPVPEEVPPAAITNSIGMNLVRIPAGKFTMGSSKQEQDAAIADHEKIFRKKPPDAFLAMVRSEGPQHEVEITKAYWLGIHEVTQGQFQKVMGYNPSYFSKDGEGKKEVKYDASSKPAGGKDKVPADTSGFPVENVSYEEAVVFCKNLTAQALERGRVYRLPSEAEWEYACRAGANSSTLFHDGNSLTFRQANISGNAPSGGAAKGDSLARTCKVGSYPANAFGLYDMHGNVWEWCADWYDKDYYGKSPQRDPGGPFAGAGWVSRGGGWSDNGPFCRSASRGRHFLACRHGYLGFRVALVPSAK